MSKKVLITIILMIAIFCPTKVDGLCSNAEITRRSALAKNISITYNYIEENGKVSFYLTFTNMQPDLYLKDVANNRLYYYSTNEITLYGYKPNLSYRFDVYGTGDCNERLYSHYVTTPGYNPYYNDPICTGVNSSICQKWVNINYDYETFVKEVNKIKEKQKTNIEEPTTEEVVGFYDYLVNFFINYYFIILPMIIIVCLIIIIKKRDKDDLF